MFSSYFEAVSFLEGLYNLPAVGSYMTDRNHTGKYLQRMRYFLNLLGNPDRGIKYIHVTGTAGKGTVTNTLHEVLFQAGKKVGSFTSPFVTTTIEKIKVGDQYISPDKFVSILNDIKPHIDYAYMHGPYGRPSYFEILIAIGFLYFKKTKCEWVVLEVGCGGRFDATNVIEKPIVTAITNIDYDHTELIGKTLTKIAYEKGGIIKPGSTFFTTEQRPHILQIFRNIAKKIPSVYLPHQKTYQEYNNSLVRSITRHIGIEEQYTEKGIVEAKLQCRFEQVQQNPTIILDGAHNRSKIRSTVSNLQNLTYSKLHLIIGIGDSKNSTDILKEIIPHADHIYVTRFQIKDRKCAHPKELFALANKYKKPGAVVHTSLDPNTMLDKAIDESKKEDAILITGSFFLAGELRKRWYPEHTILKHRNAFTH